MNDQQHDEKLEQDQELAEMRAGVSLLNKKWQTKVSVTISVEILRKN